MSAATRWKAVRSWAYQIRVWPKRRMPLARAKAAMASGASKRNVPSGCRMYSIFISHSGVSWENWAAQDVGKAGSVRWPVMDASSRPGRARRPSAARPGRAGWLWRVRAAGGQGERRGQGGPARQPGRHLTRLVAGPFRRGRRSPGGWLPCARQAGRRLGHVLVLLQGLEGLGQGVAGARPPRPRWRRAIGLRGPRGGCERPRGSRPDSSRPRRRLPGGWLSASPSASRTAICISAAQRRATISRQALLQSLDLVVRDPDQGLGPLHAAAPTGSARGARRSRRGW